MLPEPNKRSEMIDENATSLMLEEAKEDDKEGFYLPKSFFVIGGVIMALMIACIVIILILK